ncbi:MAG: hypothetical protein ABIT08_12640, partial [Bacteroidia bacterium]
AAAVMFTYQSMPPRPVTSSAITANEESSAISDSAGNVLFYTNGQEVGAINNLIMPKLTISKIL